MRNCFGINVADLIAPDKSQIIRFIWHRGEQTVLVTTRGDERRTRFTLDNARKCWRRFRQAGFVPTDNTGFTPDGSFKAEDTEMNEMEWDSKQQEWTSKEGVSYKVIKNEIELEAELEGGAF